MAENDLTAAEPERPSSRAAVKAEPGAVKAEPGGAGPATAAGMPSVRSSGALAGKGGPILIKPGSTNRIVIRPGLAAKPPPAAAAGGKKPASAAAAAARRRYRGSSSSGSSSGGADSSDDEKDEGANVSDDDDVRLPSHLCFPNFRASSRRSTLRPGSTSSPTPTYPSVCPDWASAHTPRPAKPTDLTSLSASFPSRLFPQTWREKALAGKLSKADKLGVVDHATIEYPPFRKNFYIESPEIAKMTDDEIKELRKSLEGIKCRGRDVPAPIKTWYQAGLSQKVLEVIKKCAYGAPMAIQAQALPVIMSGRDCIGIAKTGSGKTLAFVLPLLRHAKDQPELEDGDGMIGLIMAPTRELVMQIGKDCKKFAKAMGLITVCVYGGSGVAAQIGELKRGAHVVVCTPGRMIDILATSGGRCTNLRRVTYLVLDEADRMFDMGFEPQARVRFKPYSPPISASLSTVPCTALPAASQPC